MAKLQEILVRDTTIRSFSQNGWDYICITDIARQKNALEPKDVVKNWMRLKNTIEYLGMWEALNNPQFKGVEFDPHPEDNIFWSPNVNRMQCLRLGEREYPSNYSMNGVYAHLRG